MSLDRIKASIGVLPEVAAWPQMAELVERIRPGGPLSVWELPFAACEAVGGSPEAALPGSAAILCSLISLHLVDDMLDDDPAGDYHRLGAGPAANLALAFQAAGQQLLAEAPQDTRSALQASLSRMALATAFGQSLDARELEDEDEYWQVVGAKTSPLFGAAFAIGALLGGAPAALSAPLGRLGGSLGLCIQVSDDLLDALRTPAAADWHRRPNNLALLYAMTADHPERDRFLELSARPDDPAALAAAQEILVRSGAASYCVFKMIEILEEARSLLAGLPLAAPAALSRLFDAQARSIRHLFESAGAADAATLSWSPP
ncbi:MAG TPA: polyprenyl synthetase family protein [Thermoanaerobaculia bacterium]|nr:polyprenyl synthetase family protein [Thermoanaerobaculia bacterium]